MEVKIRSWCCSLATAGLLVGGGMIVLYLAGGCLVLAKVWDTHGRDFDDLQRVYQGLGLVEHSNIFLTIAASISLLGIISSLSLIVGISMKSPIFLLPWLVWHVVIILCCIGTGLYLVIHFMFLKDQREVLSAVLSIVPILVGVFLIFLWVLMDQLYIQLRQRKISEGVKNMHDMQDVASLTIKDTKPAIRDTDNKRTRSNPSFGSLRPPKQRRNQIIQNRYFNHQGITSGQSRSMEYILDSSSFSSNSTYQSEIISCKLPGVATLPRLRRCPDNPNKFRAYIDCSSSNSINGTVRSCKSVSIPTYVTEGTYTEKILSKKDEKWPETLSCQPLKGLNEDTRREDIIKTIPTPLYPTISGKHSWKAKLGERRKSFTKNQIIDMYCSQD